VMMAITLRSMVTAINKSSAPMPAEGSGWTTWESGQLP
jgi:hypothetical protein